MTIDFQLVFFTYTLLEHLIVVSNVLPGEIPITVRLLTKTQGVRLRSEGFRMSTPDTSLPFKNKYDQSHLRLKIFYLSPCV